MLISVQFECVKIQGGRHERASNGSLCQRTLLNYSYLNYYCSLYFNYYCSVYFISTNYNLFVSVHICENIPYMLSLLDVEGFNCKSRTSKWLIRHIQYNILHMNRIKLRIMHSKKSSLNNIFTPYRYFC